jgi:hypothetical protein
MNHRKAMPAQGQGHRLCLLRQPDAGFGRNGWDREPDEHIGDDEQHGKEDTGDGRRARRFES